MIGHSLVARLCREGKTVIAHSRPSSDVRFLDRLGIRVVCCELTNDEALHHALKGVDCIVHLAGAVSAAAPFSANDPETQEHYRQVNIELTGRLLNAAQINLVRRFVYCSSVSVYAPDACSPIAEDAPVRPASDYGISKRKAEILVETAATEGLETVIVRPCIIVGPGDRHLIRMLRALASLPMLLIPGGGSRRIDLADVDDVSDLLWRCITQDVAVGRVYNATSGTPMAISRIAAMLPDQFKLGPILPIPHIVFQRASRLLRPYVGERLPEIAPLFGDVGIAYLKNDVVFDISRARRELGFKPAGQVGAAVARALHESKL
ncbi:MAG: hypothetical protein QOF14_5788 [Hyphomicrobiales bacterium]|jgi:nucleoside-diphosphate-sugar epimerase|nr:hypothetical protein [Hyphomicrobiales bacterium]